MYPEFGNEDRKVAGEQEIVKLNPASVPRHRIILRDRVLGEVEKNSFIALPGKGGHSGLMPSKLCVPPWRG